MTLKRDKHMGQGNMLPWVVVALLLSVSWQVVDVDRGYCSDDVTRQVDIKRHVLVNSDKVCLRDIADLQEPCALLEDFGDTCLAISPGPGKTKTIPGSWISAKLRPTSALNDDIVFNVPDYVRVERNYQELKGDVLRQYYTEYIARKLRGTDVNFRVSRFRVSGNGPLPEGDISVELTQQGKRDLVGNVRLVAMVWVDKNMERRLTLSGWVDRFEEVVCVAHTITRHETITRGDIVIERRNVAKLPENVLRVEDKAIGKRVKHTCRSGEVLTERDVEAPPIVKKGDRVKILAESPSLTITTIGIAQGKGFLGDIIRVKNISSNKDVMASIVDSATVRVSF